METIEAVRSKVAALSSAISSFCSSLCLGFSSYLRSDVYTVSGLLFKAASIIIVRLVVARFKLQDFR